MATLDQKHVFTSQLIAAATQLLYAYNTADDLLTRYFDLGLSGQFADADFEGHGGLDHLTEEDVTAAVTTIEAIKTLMEAGHRSNLNRIIR
jgi:hypothetical protein